MIVMLDDGASCRSISGFAGPAPEWRIPASPAAASPGCELTTTAVSLSPKLIGADRPQHRLHAVTDTASVEAARLDLGAGDFDIDAGDLEAASEADAADTGGGEGGAAVAAAFHVMGEVPA